MYGMFFACFFSFFSLLLMYFMYDIIINKIAPHREKLTYEALRLDHTVSTEQAPSPCKRSPNGATTD